MKVSLVVSTAGNSNGKVIPIRRFPFVIGRDPECNLRPASPVVSNRHCVLESRARKLYLKDLGSTNGTLVNNKPVTSRELRAGDQITIGPLCFIVQVEVNLPVDQNTPLPPALHPAEKATDEDSIADVLLSMPDDTTKTAAEGTRLDSAGIPVGATDVFDKAPSGEDTLIDDTAASAVAKPEKPKPQKVGDTTSAANEILKKYLRRK